MQIYSRCLDALMTEGGLDDVQRNPSVCRMCGVRVSERVRCHPAHDPYRLAQGPHIPFGCSARYREYQVIASHVRSV